MNLQSRPVRAVGFVLIAAACVCAAFLLRDHSPEVEVLPAEMAHNVPHLMIDQWDRRLLQSLAGDSAIAFAMGKDEVVSFSADTARTLAGGKLPDGAVVTELWTLDGTVCLDYRVDGSRVQLEGLDDGALRKTVSLSAGDETRVYVNEENTHFLQYITKPGSVISVGVIGTAEGPSTIPTRKGFSPMAAPTLYIALAVVAVLSYLFGSINTAIIVSRIYAGDDVRRHGSGNAGMTNMLRTYGKWPAIFTAAGDFLKGVVAILLSRLIFYLLGLTPENGLPLDPGYVSGLFVLLGHLFPVFFRFKGGKGVVTTLSVIFMTDPLAFLIIAAVFVPLAALTRIVSLGSVLGAIAYPVVTWFVRWFRGEEPLYDTICAAVIALIVIYMHRANIKRLLNGTENRFGQKKPEDDLEDED